MKSAPSESERQTSSPAPASNLHADRTVKTLGLCMIVKNKSKVVLRCLESVRPILDYVLVEDTGSTDGTQTIIREWLDRVGLPGEVYDEPWRDFGYNRSHALAKLRKQNSIDYALILDADDEFIFEQEFDIAAFKSSLCQDLYDVELVTRDSPCRHRAQQICSNRREFLYRGVLHEFIDTADRALSWGPGKIESESARGLFISSTRQGSRSQSPDKYREDAQLFEEALLGEKDNFLRSRYTFYLARSYRDAGEKEKALDYFLKRAELGFSIDEIYIGLFSAGQIQQEMGRIEDALATYRRATETVANRAEALHAASRLCRESKRFAEGYEYARRGLAIPLPLRGLFVEPWRYEYGLLDELAVNAYWIGKYQECIDACQHLLREDKLPAHMNERVRTNIDFAADKLSQGADANHEDRKAAAAAGAKILATQNSDRPRIFGCFGLHRSGSTWMFNLVREVCRTQGIEFVSLHRDWDENLPWNLLGTKLIVVKTHSPSASFQSLIANCSEPAVITVREPRDAVVSSMQRLPNTHAKSFDEALKAIAHSAQTLTATARSRKISVFRYEDSFVGNLETLNQIATLLDTSLLIEDQRAILSGLSLEAVRTKIKALEAAGTIRGEEIWDQETHWHAKHVGDGKVGKFETVLSLAQQREVLERTREFCEHFGYNTSVEKPIDSEAVVKATSASLKAPPTPPIQATTEEPKRGKKIGLCMIVKNETKLIRRCLVSVLPLVDYILVVDTGSTDGTQQMIRDFLAEMNVDGVVIEEPWRDFAYNRSFSLAKLREAESVDYAMIIDADDTLEIDAGFDPVVFKAQMTADLYDVPVRHAGIAHHRPQLLSNRLAFSFQGVLHEILEEPPGDLKRETLGGFAVRASTGGARSQNPRKYQDDAAVLERALATETNPFLISRYTFYLAQSYKDCGEREKAVENYLKRADHSHWNEEIYISLFEAGNLMAALGRPFDEVIATWERANQNTQGRAEVLHAASRYCRDNGRNAEGMEFARRGINLKEPNGLFVQPWIYEYGILDEFAVNAYWAGAYRESLDACLRLLASNKLPSSMIQRIVTNARFAASKVPMAEPPNLGTLGVEDFIQQHALLPQRSLHSRVKGSPRVMLAILAKQKELALPLYLDCIEVLEYPKSSIALYIRTNNNTDKTEQILRDWMARVGHLYHSVEFDASNVTEKVEQFREHEWNATRFSVLGRLRNLSMSRAIELECDYYFVADIDNFIRPATLRELVALDLPIASPFLRSITPGEYYSNYHAEVDANGYYRNCDQYHWILNRHIRGVVEVPVVHCTYLIRVDVIPQLTYEDSTGRHEYVVFSDSARKASIPQYFDNRQIYGYITFGEGDDHHVVGGIDRARGLLNIDRQNRPSIEGQTEVAKVHYPAAQEPNSEPSAARTTRLKTLVFCTAFAKTKDKWDSRYHRWLQAIRSSDLEYDNILILDDGSPELPDWSDITIVSGSGEIGQNPPPKALLYHFREHLGRKALFDFPGWYRSFVFAGRYALAHGFEKVVHIESDAFLISPRVQNYFNNVKSGWTTLWCPVHRLPESAIQIIAGDSVRRFAALQQTHPHERIVGREFELQLPFDAVELRFIGDRYGEHSSAIPRQADYAVQVRDGQSDDYYWWLQGRR
jgi:glycosyltransferase involved in cell wall biosynthesis